MRVLIAEDDYLVCQDISYTIKKLGYEIIGIASNGEKAVDMCNALNPDVILMDIKMPKMNGIDASKIINEQNPTPIIILTAHESKDLVEEASKAGVGAYLTKPPKKDELERAVFIAVSRHKDLMKSKDLIKKLETKEEELKQLNNTKNRFFSILAHDLRGPIAALMTFTGQLAKDAGEIDPNELAEYLSNINHTTRGVYELLDNLLLWSKIQSHRIKIDPREFKLENIIKKVISLYSTNAVKKEISIKNAITESYSLIADENMIYTIIRNLVSNAIKFTPENGNIEISADQVNNKIVINISDTGIGMSDKVMNKLFQIDNTNRSFGTAGEEGSGLGLIICKELIEQNNGNIQVSSEPGKGSTFSIYLPMINYIAD